MRMGTSYRLMLFLALLPVSSPGQHFGARFKNQVSAWSTVNFADPVNYQFGGRYLPAINLADSMKKGRMLDLEASVNAFGDFYFTGREYDDREGDLKPYRLWLRYSTPRLELRLGLQKINFGSATILRPLMWFDKMDFRDPLQLTDGVYAFLGRYYFQNNANIWFWALYGNDQTKGWEVVPTKGKTPEFGGRAQIPVDKGEVALTVHHREAEFILANDSLPVEIRTAYPEDKVGIDGKWDLGVGLAAEYTVRHNKVKDPMIPEWETYLSLGLDYTVPLGNGLNFNAEYFRHSARAEFYGTGDSDNFAAIALNYPIGIINSLTGIVYYNWDKKEWYRMVSLQWKYDFWSFYLLAFWNPERFSLYGNDGERNLFAGKGIQVMAVVNF
jgi:hypothetical protein